MLKFFKKLCEQKEKIFEEEISGLNLPLEDRKISPSIAENMVFCRQLFSDMDIIRYRTLTAKGGQNLRFFLVFCDGMVNYETINDNIIRPLNIIAEKLDYNADYRRLTEMLQVADMKMADNFGEVVEAVTFGDTVLFSEGSEKAIVLDTRKYLMRAVEEPDNEKVLLGPREGFTELLMQNLSQVVRRVHSNELKTKLLTLGRRTKTPVCVCYIDSLADKSVLEKLMERLNKIDIDGVLDANYINEMIRDHRFSLFRTIGYTERPDTVAGKLLEGRIAIFVEGSPVVLTVPYLFIENFQSSEDYYLSFYYTSFSRLMRICAFLLTITIPGLYIAIVAFHQEMLPLRLLMHVALERQSVPLPAAMEAVVMLLVFDILRETGIRMPSKIGQALSIVGALVIGQAAVEASLVAAPMIIVVASTGITGLLVPKLNVSVILWRFILLLFATSFGFFGFTIGLSLMLIQINNLSSFGIEQLSMKGRLRFQNVKDIFFRAPWPMMKNRPEAMTSNIRRMAGSEDDV